MSRPLVFHLLPHTHWDREWYLPRAVLHARLVAMLDDLLDRFAAEPELRAFLLDGQTVHVEDYLRVRPERAAEVAARVREGRLQVGPWYILADEVIPSGEALVRNLLAGAADCARLGGRLDVLYSPDAFGHPAVLPLLANDFGLRWGVVWRGLGQAGAAHDLFLWCGQAGATLPLYHLPPGGYEVGASLPADRAALRKVWAALRADLVSRASSRHVLVPVGADHHAVHPDIGALRRSLAELEPGHEVRVSRLDEFLAAATSDGVLEPVSGELRWSYGYTWTLQGTHATRARQKRRNARLELLLERAAEPLAALARLRGGADRGALLDAAWRTLLQGQFHDVLCGTVSDEVAAALDVRHDEVEGYACEIARASLWELVGHDPDRARERGVVNATPQLALWNPAARPRSGVAEATLTWFRRDVLVGPPGGRRPRTGRGAPVFHLTADDGTPVPVQVLGNEPGLERLDAVRHYPDLDQVDRVRVAFVAPETPGLGFRLLRPAVGRRAPRGDASASGRALRNRHLEVTVQRDGSIAMLARETGERFDGLLRLEIERDDGDTYTFCPPPTGRAVRSRGPVKVRTLAAGPLIAAMEVAWPWRVPAHGTIALRWVLTLAADSPVLRCRLELDNAATDCRLRVRLPTGLAGVAAVAGTQFGAAAREAVTVTGRFPAETPVTTAPAHRFVAAARGARGLALLAPGFFEHEWTASGDLLLTLFRAVGQLSRNDLRTRPGHAAWPTATPLAQSPGADAVDLALAPVDARSAEPAALSRLWEDRFAPLAAHWLRDAIGLSVADTGIEIEGDGLVLSAVKPPADGGQGLAVRCYNPGESLAAGTLRLSRGFRRAHRCRADEQPVEELRLEAGGTRLPLHVAAGDVVVLKLS